jgi:hypothetical protein
MDSVAANRLEVDVRRSRSPEPETDVPDAVDWAYRTAQDQP